MPERSEHAGPVPPGILVNRWVREVDVRFLHVVVSNEGFRKPDANTARLEVLDGLLGLAAREGASLLVLPAGYLAATAPDAVPRLIENVAQRAERAGIAILGGVDSAWPETKKRSPTHDEAVREGKLPYLLFAVGPLVAHRPESLPWRQVSTTSANGRLLIDETIPAAERTVTVDGVSVAVLACGELFNERIRRSVSRLGVRLVVDLGHSGMGTGLVPAMTRIALDGHCAVAHAQHLADATGRGIHFVDADGVPRPAPAEANLLVGQGNLWAGWTVREV